MKISELIQDIVVAEGQRINLSIAQVTEVIGLVAERVYEDPEAIEALIASGRRRRKIQARGKVGMKTLQKRGLKK